MIKRKRWSTKSQTIFYTLMLGAIILVLGLAFTKPIKQVITQTTTDMNCSAPSTLSEYDQATCISWDIVLWLSICTFLAIGIIIIGAKVIGG